MHENSERDLASELATSCETTAVATGTARHADLDQRLCAAFCIHCAGFCAAHGVGVVVIGHLQIVLVCDRRGIADPGAYNVQREIGCQFSLPTGPQVVK